MSILTADTVAGEVRDWLAANWDPDLTLVEWRRRLADSGWGCPMWPLEWYGRGLPPALASVVSAEFARVEAVGVSNGVGLGLAAPTLLEHGSDELKRRLLRPTITGEVVWCQLFSEPGSGSDLASLMTRADRDGDEFRISGQKVWNTGAHRADLGLLVARTNWDVPKHAGITYLVIDMHQPGIEVRPLHQMNGHQSFNEVFFDDARVPVDNVVGRIDGGWTVALATLAHERRLAEFPRPDKRAVELVGRVRREAAAEAADAAEPHKWYPQRAGRVDLVVERAQATGTNRDPVVRQEIVRLLSMARTAQWTAARARAARLLGRPPGAEGSIGKLASSHIARAAARVHALISGASGMLTGADDPLGGVIAEILVSVPAISIAGGTDEIQRNILGERVLGLPKEPQVDRDVAFRDVPRNVDARRRSG